MKRTYETPALSVVGSLVNTTGGGQNRNNLDQSFPVGTPDAQLTFS